MPVWRVDRVTVAQKLIEIASAAAGLAFPVGPLFDTLRAISPGSNGDDDWFTDRLVAEIAHWCEENAVEIARIGGTPSGWHARLRDRLVSSANVALLPAGEAADVLGQVLFSPLIPSPAAQQASAALAARLGRDLPHLIVRAGDKHGAIAAILQVWDRGTIAELAGGIAPDNLLIGYLSGLISALDQDSWSRRAGAPGRARLSSVRQPLAIHPQTGFEGGDGDSRLGTVVDADDLLDSCDRLVVLGGVGQGKSWLARYAVITAARRAIRALDAGHQAEMIEIPLIARCSSVLERTDELRWRLMVLRSVERSTVYAGHVADLTRVLEAHPKVLVVLDGLDEARASADALDELLSARPFCRVVLTSRPSCWANQLELTPGNAKHRIGHLRPLRWPEDVEAAVGSQLESEPTKAAQLMDRFRARGDLADQATNPLLCAMHCLVAVDDGVAEHRDELYDRVIRRLVANTWRNNQPTIDEVEAAEDYLVALAWAGAEDDPATGLGAWPDEIGFAAPDLAIADLVANVANRTDSIVVARARSGRRRFLHRTLREYLVARHLTALPAEQVAANLFPRLWFDRDWEDVVPLAVAAHPDRSALLRRLVELIRSISEIDTFGVEADLLARIRDEVPIERFGPSERALLAGAGSEPHTSVRRAHTDATAESRRRFTALLRGLLSQPDPIATLAAALATTSTTDRARRQPLIAEIIAAADTRVAAVVATAWRRSSEAEREHFMRLIADVVLEADLEVYSVVEAAVADGTLVAREAARRALLPRLGRGDPAADAAVAAGLVHLAVTSPEEVAARQALVELVDRMVPEAMGTVATTLTLLRPTSLEWERLHQVLLGRMREARAGVAASIAGGLVGAPPDTLGEARRTLVSHLDGANPEDAAAVTATLLALDLTVDDLRALVALDRSEGLAAVGEAVRRTMSTGEWLALLPSLGAIAAAGQTVRTTSSL